jgi:hypothetical protein
MRLLAPRNPILVPPGATATQILLWPDFATAYGRGEVRLWKFFSDSDSAESILAAIAESNDKKCARALQGILGSGTVWAHKIVSGCRESCKSALRKATDVADTKPFVSNFLLNFVCHVLMREFEFGAMVFTDSDTMSALLDHIDSPVIQSQFPEMLEGEHPEEAEFFLWHFFRASFESDFLARAEGGSDFCPPPRRAAERWTFKGGKSDPARRLVAACLDKHTSGGLQRRPWRDHFLLDGMLNLLNAIALDYKERLPDEYDKFLRCHLDIAKHLTFSRPFLGPAIELLDEDPARAIPYIHHQVMWLQPTTIAKAFEKTFKRDELTHKELCPLAAMVRAAVDKKTCWGTWEENVKRLFGVYPHAWNCWLRKFLDTGKKQGCGVVMAFLADIALELVGDRELTDQAWIDFRDQVLKP